MRAVMESNPEVAQMMRDPAMLRQVSRDLFARISSFEMCHFDVL
jgi:ubiquilin